MLLKIRALISTRPQTAVSIQQNKKRKWVFRNFYNIVTSLWFFLVYFINVGKVKNTKNKNKNQTFTPNSLRSTDLELWLFWIYFWRRVIWTHVPLLSRLHHNQLLGFNLRQGQALFKLGSPLHLTRRIQTMTAVSLYITIHSNIRKLKVKENNLRVQKTMVSIITVIFKISWCSQLYFSHYKFEKKLLCPYVCFCPL